MKTLAIIPAFGVADQISNVVASCMQYVDSVLVVDDCCPEQSGKIIDFEFSEIDSVSVVYHERNMGVGGAMKTGFQWGLDNLFDVFVKVDGDGQIKPELIPQLIAPILTGTFDFRKGNRFDSPRTLREMPPARLIGNSFLSLLSKISSGYWTVSDPTNGFFAIGRDTLERLEPDRLANDYFFESDLLFRLSTVRARVSEMPMVAIYGEERSNLNIWRVLWTFPLLHTKNFAKRIIYNYYVRDWSIGSIEFPTGLILMFGGVWFGLSSYKSAQAAGVGVTAGEAVTTAISIILGFQLLLSFVAHDIQNERR